MRVKQSPAQIPPIFSGDSFTIYGLIEAGSDADQVTISGKLAGKEIAWHVPVSFENNGELIPTLWARNHLRDIESGIELESGSKQTYRKAASLKKTLVEIGKRFHLVSSETSFVAIETRSDSEKTTVQAVYRRVPIQLTKDWHGGEVVMLASLSTMMECAGSELPTTNRSESMAFSRSIGSDQNAEPAMHYLASRARSQRRSKELHETEGGWIYELLRTQRAAGCFDLTMALAKFVKRPFKILRNLASQIEGVDKGMQEKVLATAFTLLVLEKKGGEFKDQWGRADTKARKWLNDYAKDAHLFGKPILEWLGEDFSDKGLNLPSDQNVVSPDPKLISQRNLP